MEIEREMAKNIWMPDKNIEAGLDSNFFSVIRMKLNFCANKNCTFKPSVAF